MWSPKTLVGIVSLTIPLIASATSVPFERNLRYRREIITPDELAESYDFVIAGGGVAGLVLAARLTEYSDNTVLVLEAGDTGDDVKNTIGMWCWTLSEMMTDEFLYLLDPPAAAYYISLLNTPYDWSYQTSPQNNAGDRPLGWPRGKVSSKNLVTPQSLLSPSFSGAWRVICLKWNVLDPSIRNRV